ncbi:MAG: right-handed parallel beta-helix repeat-containing protein [Candidatus Heimdallarchaeaceae archaeon]
MPVRNYLIVLLVVLSGFVLETKAYNKRMTDNPVLLDGHTSHMLSFRNQEIVLNESFVVENQEVVFENCVVWLNSTASTFANIELANCSFYFYNTLFKPVNEKYKYNLIFHASSKGIINNCTFISAGKLFDDTRTNQHGLYVFGSSVEIYNSTFIACYTAIDFDYGGNSIVANCTFLNYIGYAIESQWSKNIDIANCTFLPNEVPTLDMYIKGPYNPEQSAGIGLRSSKEIKIVCNLFNQTEINALKIVDCQEVVLINNTVMFCGSSLEIIQSDKLRVVGNVFSNVTYLGSSFAESSLILFQGNTISSASTGLYMLSVRDVTISGNNISNANTGIVISNNDAGGSNIKVMMNNLLNCSTSATSNAGATWSGNYFDKASDNPLVISDTDVDYEPSSKMIVDTKPPRLLSLNATKTLDGTRLSFDIDEPFGIVEFIFFYEKMEYFPLFNYSSGFWYIVMATNLPSTITAKISVRDSNNHVLVLTTEINIPQTKNLYAVLYAGITIFGVVIVTLLIIKRRLTIRSK